MWFISWLQSWKRTAPAAPRRKPTSPRQRGSFRPRLEALEDRALPSATLSINDVTHVASLSGQTAYVFTVGLSQPGKQSVNVNYATADGTAIAAAGDYVPTAGTLHLGKGQTSQTITVLVNAATPGELTETFLVRLTSARNASIYDGYGVGTIVPPFVTANDDSNWTYFDMGVSGNLLINDVDPSGGGLTVSSVNGSAANVGTTIQLASGALVTINADGAFTYDPNRVFDWLAWTGMSTYDSFTYTVTDSLGHQSNTATVSIFIYDPYIYA